MTNIAQDLKTHIIAASSVYAAVNERVHYNNIPADSQLEHIWYRTSSDTEDRTLDGTGGLHELFMDIECAAETEGEAQDLSDMLKDLLDGTSGAVGNSSVQGMFLSAKDDSYEPRVARDEGVHVVAFDLHCFYTT